MNNCRGLCFAQVLCKNCRENHFVFAWTLIYAEFYRRLLETIYIFLLIKIQMLLTVDIVRSNCECLTGMVKPADSILVHNTWRFRRIFSAADVTIPLNDTGSRTQRNRFTAFNEAVELMHNLEWNILIPFVLVRNCCPGWWFVDCFICLKVYYWF